jgi:hypothetical protein
MFIFYIKDKLKNVKNLLVIQKLLLPLQPYLNKWTK